VCVFGFVLGVHRVQGVSGTIYVPSSDELHDCGAAGIGLLFEFPYAVEHGQGEAANLLLTVQVVERVSVSAEDDGGGHAWESVDVTGEPCVRVYGLAKDVRHGELEVLADVDLW